MCPPPPPRHCSYYGNLRGAKATDTYIATGGDEETYQPTFTQHGFRFCEVQGLSGKLDAADIIAVEMHSDLRQTGTFSTSSWLLNKIQNNTVWGQKDNLMSVPTDCDQRDERRGWMGDAALTAEEATCRSSKGARRVLVS